MLVLKIAIDEPVIIRRDGVEIGRIIVTELCRKKTRLAFSRLEGLEINRAKIDALKHGTAK